MAQYVHNYVFCSSEAKETVMSEETIYKLSGRYEELITPLKDDYFLVVFDTYGPDYCDDFIKGFISKYRDTIWYCIEECMVEQGYFFWNGKEVELSVRKLVETLSGNEIYILYSDAEYRPIQLILFNDEKMIIEKILLNQMNEYVFGKKSPTAICNYMNTFAEKISDDWVEFDLPMKNGMDITVHICWEGKSIQFLTYNEHENDQAIFGNDEHLYNELIGFVRSVLAEKAIEAKFSIPDIVSETIKYR